MSENQNIEWKESWRDEYLKWICGFANAVGGKIYIGMVQRTGKNWDDFLIAGVTIEDLSTNALRRFRREAAKSNRVDADILNDTTEHLLYDLRLIDDDTRQLTRAAVLLFHPDPEKYVRGAYIKIGFFRNDNEDLAFQDEVHGSLMEQIDKTMDLIKTKYLIYSISYEGGARRETPQFPVEALRESLMNCIAHKSYEDATPTQISVYPVLIILPLPMLFLGVEILRVGDVGINVFWRLSVLIICCHQSYKY